MTLLSFQTLPVFQAEFVRGNFRVRSLLIHLYFP